MKHKDNISKKPLTSTMEDSPDAIFNLGKDSRLAVGRGMAEKIIVE